MNKINFGEEYLDFFFLRFYKLCKLVFGPDGDRNNLFSSENWSCSEIERWYWLPVQFIIWLGWEEQRISNEPFGGWNGNFFPSLISLWVSSAVSAVSTQKRNSVKALSALWECFFPPTACSHPPLSPSWTDMLEETYATIPTSWQLVLLE